MYKQRANRNLSNWATKTSRQPALLDHSLELSCSANTHTESLDVLGIREFAEHIAKLVERSSQKPSHVLEWRLVGCARVAARGRKHLGPLEALAQLLGLLLGQRLFEDRHMVFLLFLDVLGQVLHEVPDSRLKLNVRGTEALELVELLLDLLMLLSILVGHLFAVGQVLLHGGVDDQLFTDRVASQLPRELVLPASLFIDRAGVQHVVVVLLDLSMVLLDGFRDASHGCGKR
jgi:hypothetical protein